MRVELHMSGIMGRRFSQLSPLQSINNVAKALKFFPGWMKQVLSTL
jgi:hypothetical protein